MFVKVNEINRPQFGVRAMTFRENNIIVECEKTDNLPWHITARHVMMQAIKLEKGDKKYLITIDPVTLVTQDEINQFVRALDDMTQVKIQFEKGLIKTMLS